MVDLAVLEERLASLSHSAEAITLVRDASGSLRNTSERMALWNRTNAIVRAPLLYESAKELGFTTPDDRFIMLQGDIVQTDSAYFMGSRTTGAKYAVLNSSCDLVPARSEHSLLLKIFEIKRLDLDSKALLSQLAKFSRADSMYIPALQSDGPDVLGNQLAFDGICQINQRQLLLARRIASLSLIGWRIFASFARNFIARANPRESEIRSAIQAHEDR